MIHPDATVDECMEEIGALEREIERLRTIEIAAWRAYEYHCSGYGRVHSGFEANTQLDLMNALGRALGEKT
jgi:hypothetical protein